uniref:Uncharacterized protein n=1 Tax=Anopheles atroparvus TaxID=41427 RepID=A0AAG5DIL0_ANOAO
QTKYSLTSCGCSTLAMQRAASSSFSYVRPRLMMCTPSVRRLYTYCSIWKFTEVLPMCVVAANILVTSSSLRERTSRFPDIVPLIGSNG